jgi:hypothetical protein
MKLFTPKLRGLWVGVALGELYATEHLVRTFEAEKLKVRETLPKTYGLSMLASRQMKNLIPQEQGFGLRCPRWQDVLLNVVPLAFLHPAGTQGLTALLSSWSIELSDRERFASAIVVVQTLEWLLHQKALESLLPYLLKRPELQQTQTAAHLEIIQQHLHRRTSLQSLVLHQDKSAQWQPGGAIAQVLYVVLSTPNDFRLTVQRASLLLGQQPELVMLAAALSGFHNGLTALPLDWRWALKTLHWDILMPFETGLYTLADLCAGQWAGCAISGIPAGVVFHSPGQLRPR